jgi:hypothetical protein
MKKTGDEKSLVTLPTKVICCWELFSEDRLSLARKRKGPASDYFMKGTSHHHPNSLNLAYRCKRMSFIFFVFF